MATNINLIENILKEFSRRGEDIIRLAELQSRLIITSTPVNIAELKNTVLRLKSLFAFIDYDLICVYITLKACTHYNLRGCPDNDCPDLHICEKLLSAGGCWSSCRLSHSFDTAEIKAKLIKDRFDYKILMKFYQTFYKQNLVGKAEEGKEAYVLLKEIAKSDEESCPIEHRRVMVKLPDNFIKQHNRKYLFDLFSNRDKTDGGYIESLDYKPNEHIAIIKYQEKSTADRLLKKRGVQCDGFMFLVTKVDEKQSPSDYVSSKSKKNSTEAQRRTDNTDSSFQLDSIFSTPQALANNQMNETGSQAKPTEEENANLVSRQAPLPMNVYQTHTALIVRLVQFMRKKFKLECCFVDEENFFVDFIGPSNNVKRAVEVFTMCVYSENSRIKTRPVSSFNLNILKATRLDEILQDAYKEVDELVFDVRVCNLEHREEPAIFVSYFYNIAEIDSIEDTVYDYIQRSITSIIAYDEIDMTAHARLFNSPAWTAYRDEIIFEQIARNNFEIITNPIVNERVIMSLIGEKTCVRKGKYLIEDFIAQNISRPLNAIELDSDKIKFLQDVLRNYIQILQTLFGIRFVYYNTSLKIENCSEMDFKKIESHINMLLRRKCSKTYVIGALSDIMSVLKDMQFYTDVLKIEDELEGVIIPEIRKKDYTSSPFSSDNENILSVGINNSKINLQTGNIIKSKVDGIVNLISSQPEVNQGVLAQAVFQAAGPSVLNEVMSNGDGQDLVVTTAGDLKQTRCIFHCHLSDYVSEYQATRDIKSLIKNCLDLAIVYELKSIAFPTIGLDKKNYPLEIVSNLMISTVSEFLAKNKNVPLTVCIVIFKNDESKILEAFRNSIEKKNLLKIDAPLSLPFESENLVIRVLSTNLNKCDQAAERIKNLLDRKYNKSEIKTDFSEMPRFEDIVGKFARELVNQRLILYFSNQKSK